MGALDGKVAIVTGAGSGIGRAIAERFANEGALLLIADISGKEHEAADQIGRGSIGLGVDVTSADEVDAMVRKAVDEFGRLDVLVNNAGWGGPIAPLLDTAPQMWDQLISINLTSVYYGMRAALPVMLAQGSGSIVNTASASGLVGWEGLAAYSAAKGGVVQLTKSAALDYAKQGIRVNAICPGMTWTAAAGASSENSDAAPDVSLPGQPMGRFGLPSELAAAALFLASDDASFVTGVAMPVDGGYVAL